MWKTPFLGKLSATCCQLYSRWSPSQIFLGKLPATCCQLYSRWSPSQIFLGKLPATCCQLYSRWTPSQIFSKNVINISKQSHFPQDCKVSTDPKNFRPILLLPIASKVIEKVIQAMNNLTGNNILLRYQSGFRKNHSTDTFLSYLTDNILIR